MIHAAGAGAVLALLGMPAEARDPHLPDAMFNAVATAILTPNPVPTPATADPGAVAATFRTVLPTLPALTSAERALMAEWLTRSLTGTPPS